MMNVYDGAYQVLLQTDAAAKVAEAIALYQNWQQGHLTRDGASTLVERVPIPGRPLKPDLISPTAVQQRKLSTLEGRLALLHAVAHIEFNAINLALDAVYRFREMPDAYYGDWLQVAAEEAHHFALLRERMATLGMQYGDLAAHNGLWDQACRTDQDVMIRMALVPRVLEARGLDVTPPMMQRLREAKDFASVEVLEVILREEVGHVRIGSRWYHYCCEQRGLEPESTFKQLLGTLPTPPRSPFYTAGRLEAGFSSEELAMMLELEQQWLAEIRQR
ncbi:ferritin-like domain-containing protein [Thiofilum flexile]|uniref:ferritin-like domain-containing protein n=1 Tax=Thiofilum flexile TaxID=125627 RepID=UPI000592AE01|nr:ferritin-like domain-containing protein [Thiofilum flexile]